MYSRFLRQLIPFVAASLLVLAGCSEDSDPRPVGGSGPGINGHTTTPGDDTDVGDDADAVDDVEEDVEEPNGVCDIELPPSGDERYPCCFSDADCAASTSPFAQELRCYHAECAEGGWGTCRRPPESAATNECWADDECGDGQVCAFDPDFDVECTDPGTQEVWEVCIDE